MVYPPLLGTLRNGSRSNSRSTRAATAQSRWHQPTAATHFSTNCQLSGKTLIQIDEISPVIILYSPIGLIYSLSFRVLKCQATTASFICHSLETVLLRLPSVLSFLRDLEAGHNTNTKFDAIFENR